MQPSIAIRGRRCRTTLTGGLAALRAGLLALLAAAFAGAGLAQGGEWATYVNPRFGTTADYPAYLFTDRDPPPENADGQSFRTADGRAQLLIYGARNAQGDTPQSYLDSYVDLAGAAIAYRRVTDRFYIVSGTREGSIFYQRCNFPAAPGGIIDCLSLTYSPEDKAAWDPIVARLSNSLRAGRGIEPPR